jgi:membrane protease YdiL (CAAX protease family)
VLVPAQHRVRALAIDAHSKEIAMTTVRAAIARWPIPAYILLAFAFSWVFTFLVSVSILFGLIALFGPAVAAIIVTRADGTFGELRQRTVAWRQPLIWYVAAVGIPFGVAAIARAAHSLSGGAALGFGTISAIEIVIFVLVIGEEIGWRGFLQPRLRHRFSIVSAGAITGVIWTLWHLPIYLQPSTGLLAFAVFAWWVIPLAIVMGFVAERTRFSIIVATVMHGSANIATPILLPEVDTTWTRIVTGAIYLAVATAFVANDVRHPQASAPIGSAAA